MASLLALSTSLALLLDYLSPQMAFCSGASGCSKVRDSGFGYIMLPSGTAFPYLPALGLLGFAAIFSSSLLRRIEHLRGVLLPLSWACALAGVVLIGLQAFLIRGFCSLCLIVDVSALLVGACALLLRGDALEDAVLEEQSDVTVEPAHPPLSESHRILKTWHEDSVHVPAPHPTVPGAAPEPLRLTVMGWITLLLISLAAPLFYSSAVRSDEIPPAIAELYEEGAVNVVEFFDYQCPHCREALPTLEEALEQFDGRVHLVRKPVFLPGHPLGKTAGRIHVCAAEQGRADDVAEILLGPGHLTPELIEKAMGVDGLDPTKLEQCLESERPTQVLEQAIDRIKRADFVGLPTTYIGSERLLGAQPKAVYLAALEDAGRGSSFRGVSPPVYWLLVMLLCVVVVLASRVRPRSVLA